MKIPPNTGAAAAIVVCAAMLTISCSEKQGTLTQDAAEARAALPNVIDYNWDVRPILSENCFKCHGPEPTSRKAGLRLDIRETATAELPETPGRFAIVPGDADESELVRRITADDPEMRMPPQSEHKTLTGQQIATVRAWIDAGAEYKRHWAFIPPERPDPPQTSGDGPVRNDIDRFVLARLEREGLDPSAPADPETLINRVSLTLTGLPPTLAEVDAFVSDERPDAYERLVDRLLDSPRYAEHMAAYWMDLARFSETDGYLDDHHDRLLWPWRDWVISAFDQNMPFDQFGSFQLAGDLMPNATDEQILATVFLRAGQRTTENGAIDEEYNVEYMVDRTNNALGTAFMGLTVGCARCHDHKYDPISQQAYYSLGAFFNSIDEPGAYAAGRSQIQGGPTLPWTDEETAGKVATAADSLAEREANYARVREAARAAAGSSAARGLADASQLERALETAIQDGLAAHYSFDEATPAAIGDLPPARSRMRPPTVASASGSPPRAPPPRPARGGGPPAGAMFGSPVPRNYIAEQLTLSGAVTANVPPAVIQAPELRPGVRGNALFFTPTNKGFLGRDVGWYERTEPFSLDFWFFAAEAYDRVPVLNHKSEQDSARTGYMLEIVDGDLLVRFAHSPPENMIQLRTAEPFPIGIWTHVTLTYDGSSRAEGVKIYLDGRLAQTTVERDQLTRTMLPWDLASFFDPFVGLSFGTRFREKAPVGSGLDELRVFGDELTPVEVAYLHEPASVLNAPALWTTALEDLFVATDAQVVEARAELLEARELHNQLVSFLPQVLVMREAPEPHPTYVLERGVYSAPAEQVSPKGLESVFEWNPELPENRLGLATWLFDPENPLTARVFVNRVWQQHFGRGLVETAEDFGAQGSLPTHPELLDWLAVEFVESGWDVKNLHRLIVTSATYRQSSVVSDELLDKDARNQLLARGPRWRMTAEMVRDNALAVSGLLSERIGGPSATPYQPDAIWNPLNSFYTYPAAAAIPPEEHHRRTLYTFVKRNAPHPALKNFDFTNRTESIARRRASNTPLQALTLMNDPQFVEAYRELASRVLESSAAETERLTTLYRLAARRTPSEREIALLQQYYESERLVFEDDRERAVELINTGVTVPDPALDPVELAAMTNVAGMVMNSPGAYTVE